MRAGGVTAQVNALRVTAEARRIFVHPRHRTPHLIDHGTQAVACLFHAGEIRRDEMHACFHKQLCGKRVAFGCAPMPRAAVDKNKNRRVGFAGFVDIDLFDIGRAVCHAQRFADALAHRIAFDDETLAHIACVRRIHGLVVSSIERGLIVIHEYVRAGGLKRKCERGHTVLFVYKQFYPKRSMAKKWRYSIACTFFTAPRQPLAVISNTMPDGSRYFTS